MNLKEIEEAEKRAQAAITLKFERAKALAGIAFPNRKTGEMKQLYKAAESLAKLLELYDSETEPPALADFSRELFNECVARLLELVRPKSAPAPQGDDTQ